MKKITLPIILVLLGSLLFAPAVTGMSPIPVFLNGEKSDAEALLINGRTYVPLRYLGEKLGAAVDYRDGKVFVETKGKTALSKSALDKLPIKRIGEKITKDNIDYTISSFSYLEKSGKTHASLTFMETATVNVDFGPLPSFAYQLEDGSIGFIQDYSLTVDPEFNSKWRRCFTLEFPLPDGLKYLLYIPSRADQPIGRWIP
ncbi:MAG: copper amine oxidase N-terminal domain-containing protein [Clostridia bacterium]|nr:copper amine oxidase N-terminal domain-containing protein [Clostridia bacterium]